MIFGLGSQVEGLRLGFLGLLGWGEPMGTK